MQWQALAAAWCHRGKEDEMRRRDQDSSLASAMGSSWGDMK